MNTLGCLSANVILDESDAGNFSCEVNDEAISALGEEHGDFAENHLYFELDISGCK